MDQYPAPHSLTAISTASVNTDRPERYAKQLVSHMQQKIPCEQVTNGHRLTFNATAYLAVTVRFLCCLLKVEHAWFYAPLQQMLPADNALKISLRDILKVLDVESN